MKVVTKFVGLVVTLRFSCFSLIRETNGVQGDHLALHNTLNEESIDKDGAPGEV